MTMAASLPDSPVATFRYAVPGGVVAGTAVDIGHVTVNVGLLLAGEIEVRVGPGRPESHGVPEVADAVRVAAGGAREVALAALGGVAKGVMVRGLGSATPTLSAAGGHRFVQRRHDFRAPDTVTAAGSCDVEFVHRQSGVVASVRGRLGYSLEVSAERPGAARAPQGWFRRHEKELASIGLLLLVATPVVPERLRKSPL